MDDVYIAEIYNFFAEKYIRDKNEIDRDEEYEVDPIKDLRPVCPNCHAMIHRRLPPLSIDEIKSIISSEKLEK
ncbi:hypothetical protein PN480_18680 [Dolichospermum circinale CS-1225]|nr:hypothetical protein [Dolichospermum circinale CS-539]MDB9523955.1 hypothetical protein [Dolichospermum circinale CS-1225]